MKKILVCVVVFMCFNTVMAQQRPQFTQYFFNNYLINPAITGIERYIDTKAGYRTQWVGISGAPMTAFIYAHGPIGSGYINGNAGSFSEQGSDPNSRSFLQTYMAAEPHHGIGAYVIQDSAGPFNSIDFDATYAYHMGLAPRLNLSLGIALGVSSNYIDISKIDAEGQSDPAVLASLGTHTNPDGGLGLWLYGPTFFAGFSAQQLLSTYSVITYGGKQVPTFYLTAGYKFFISEDISVVPSAMMKYAGPVPISIDASARMMFKDAFWIGAGYRESDAVSAIVGFNVSSMLNLSYSYDYPISAINTVTSGSHEVLLGLLLNNSYKVTCPQKMW